MPVLHNTFNSLYIIFVERHDVVLSTPTTAPDITKNNSSWKLYTTNTSNSMPAEQTRPNDTDIIQTVSYLYRVQRGSETLYMWQVAIELWMMALNYVSKASLIVMVLQKDLRMPLDFSPFSCEEIQVSFLVMSKRGVSEFSPSLSLCVHGGEILCLALHTLCITMHIRITTIFICGHYQLHRCS